VCCIVCCRAESESVCEEMIPPFIYIHIWQRERYSETDQEGDRRERENERGVVRDLRPFSEGGATQHADNLPSFAEGGKGNVLPGGKPRQTRRQPSLICRGWSGRRSSRGEDTSNTPTTFPHLQRVVRATFFPGGRYVKTL